MDIQSIDGTTKTRSDLSREDDRFENKPALICGPPKILNPCACGIHPAPIRHRTVTNASLMSASGNDGKDKMFGLLKSVFRKPGENKPGAAGPRVPMPAKSASKPGAPGKAPVPTPAKAVTPTSAKAPSAKPPGATKTPAAMNVAPKAAASGSIISKMFGAFKTSSPKSAQNDIEPENTNPSAAAPTAPPAQPAQRPAQKPAVTAQSFADIPDIFPVKSPAKASEPKAPEPIEETEAPAEEERGAEVQLPLQAIVNALPFEFKGRLRQTPTDDMTVSIPVEKVLSQLSTGAVKITFGELRNAVPQAFSPQKDRDQIQITLPLHEILARINPTLLIRRDNQKQVEVPDEINSPFDDRGKGSVFTIGSGKPAPGGPAAPTPRSTTPAAPVQSAPAPVEPVPFRSSLASAPTPRRRQRHRLLLLQRCRRLRRCAAWGRRPPFRKIPPRAILQTTRQICRSSRHLQSP
jgi:hypothetical protein